MRLLSVVGVKTIEGRRATIIQSNSLYRNKVTGSLFKRGQKTTILVLCTILALYLQARDYEPLIRCQSALAEALNPVSQLVAAPFQWASNFQLYFQDKQKMLEELQTLKLQNNNLLRQNQNVQQAILENTKLREALKVQSNVLDDILTVRVSHHTYNGYSKTFNAYVSDFEAVSKHNPVLTTTGYLVGRITLIGKSNKLTQDKTKLVQITPIYDPSSRVPVKIEGTTEQAVLKGNGQQDLELIHVENPAQIKPGQLLVTSGSGGIFPAEIPVAKITHVGTSIHATPLGNLHDQDFAFILSDNNASTLNDSTPL